MIQILWSRRYADFRRATLIVGLLLIPFFSFAACWAVPSAVSGELEQHSTAFRGGSDGLVRLFENLSPSVGALYTKGDSGDLGVICTVTVIERAEGRTVLLTAAHCARRSVSYMVTLDGRRFYAARVWKLPPEEINPEKGQRPYGQPKVDMALFVVDEELPVSPVPIGVAVLVAPGRAVVTVGFPLGVTKVRYRGIVAGLLERPGSDLDGYLILQIFGAPGSSGSAVIDEATGTIVGVLVSGKQEQAGLPVIFATPVGYQRFLQAVYP